MDNYSEQLLTVYTQKMSAIHYYYSFVLVKNFLLCSFGCSIHVRHKL